MPVTAFDTETSLIRPALLAPPLACLTWQREGESAGIVDSVNSESQFREILASQGTIVGHNVAYDMAVIAESFPRLRSAIFEAYAANRVTDTMVRQHLLDVAGGGYRGVVGPKGIFITREYTLEALAKRHTDIRLVKDGWRMSYSEFIGVPLAQWPARAREVQAAARPRVLELDARIAATSDEATVKALTKERDGLAEMIAGDPERASTYPIDDARATLAVYLSQEKHAAYLQGQFRQARAAFALHLSSAWGLRTDEVGVEMLRAATQATYDALEDELMQLGLIRNDKKRTRDTKLAKARMVAVCAEEKITLRRTDAHTHACALCRDENGKPKPSTAKSCNGCKDAAGNVLPSGHDACVEHVCLDADACEATDDEVLLAYTQASVCKKVLSNDVPAMLAGIRYPVHTRYGFANSGRTTSSKPNIQNLRKLAGVREAYVPREGMVFFEADYPALESYTFAQLLVSWLGKSKLADALNAGKDPHLLFAEQILGMPYADLVKIRKDPKHPRHREVADVRQLAKIGNFGFPGGLGAPKMFTSIKKQMKPEVVARLKLTELRVKELKADWFATWPEVVMYFAKINALCDTPDGKATVESLFTKRIRGGATYCAAANNGFQGLGADCAKEAAWRIAVEQYDRPSSPLYNTRTVAFVHDEFVGEAPADRAHEAAQRLCDVMVEGANVYLPDVPIPRSKMEPVLMTRWSKDALSVFNAEGRLTPWAA